MLFAYKTSRHQKRTIANISPFTMILKGVISADVGGGAKMYKNAFFTEEFATAHPDKVGMLLIPFEGEIRGKPQIFNDFFFSLPLIAQLLFCNVVF
jgi:hypothetical protein